MPAIRTDLLRQRARARGLTPAQLAEAAERSPGHIRTILRGGDNPSVAVACALASAIGTEPEDLLIPPGTSSPIRRARLAARVSLGDLAAAIGISRPYLSNIEAGRRRADADVLAAIARELGCEPGDLQAAAA